MQTNQWISAHQFRRPRKHDELNRKRIKCCLYRRDSDSSRLDSHKVPTTTKPTNVNQPKPADRQIGVKCTTTTNTTNTAATTTTTAAISGPHTPTRTRISAPAQKMSFMVRHGGLAALFSSLATPVQGGERCWSCDLALGP